MYAVLLIPQFPLQSLLRGQSQAMPTVVVDDAVPVKRVRGRSGKAPVVAMNAQAREAGVQLGMTATQAQARGTGLRVLTRDRVEEVALYRTVINHVLEHCADVEATEPGLVTMDLYGCGAWRADWKGFGEGLCRALGRALRLEVVLGIGRTPDQARVAALALIEGGAVVKVLGKDAAAALAEEPVSLLEPSSSLREVLHLWGVSTVGQFLALPRDAVGERLGEDAVRLWDLVGGKRRRLLRLVRPPVSYEHRCDLDHELENLEPLLFLLRRGIETLATRLANHYLVAAQVRVTLRLAGGEESCETFRVPDPTADVEMLFRIVRRRLETLASSSPVIGLVLGMTPGKSKKRQRDFFHAGLNDPNRFAHTLGELEALLGSERVGCPRALDTHRPDAFVLEPFDRSVEQAVTDRFSQASEEGPIPLGLPLQRCRPPIAIRVSTTRLRGMGASQPKQIHDGPHPGIIQSAHGPWRSSGDWWDTARWQREEWDVELENGPLCCLVRFREQWRLEGLYG